MGCHASQGCHEIAYSQLLIDSSVVSAEGHYLNTTKNESVGQVKMKRVALRSLGSGDSFSLLLPFFDLFC